MRQSPQDADTPSCSRAQHGHQQQHRAGPAQQQRGAKGGQGRCDICNCTVPGGSWAQHAAGIRHRRNLLSVRVHGEPGHHVISTFEAAAMDAVPVPAHLVSKDPVVAAARQRAASHGEASASAAPSQAASKPTQKAARDGPSALQRLQQKLLTELAAQTGLGDTYHRAGSRFGEQELACAAQRVQREVEHQQEQQAEEQGSSRRLVVGAASGWPAADLACLSLHVGHEASTWTELVLTVPFHTSGPECAAVSSACSVLAASLAKSGGLRRLQMRFARVDLMRILEEYRSGIGGLTHLWGYVLGSFKRALQVNAAIAEFVLEAPCTTFRPDDISGLQTGMLQAPARLRTAILLGAHPRVGAASPLRLLPAELLAKVVRLAVPTSKREMLLTWQEPIELTSSEEEEIDSDPSEDSMDGLSDEYTDEEEGSEESGPPSPHDHADLAVAAAAAAGHYGAFGGGAMPSSSS